MLLYTAVITYVDRQQQNSSTIIRVTLRNKGIIFLCGHERASGVLRTLSRKKKRVVENSKLWWKVSFNTINLGLISTEIGFRQPMNVQNRLLSSIKADFTKDFSVSSNKSLLSLSSLNVQSSDSCESVLPAHINLIIAERIRRWSFDYRKVFKCSSKCSKNIYVRPIFRWTIKNGFLRCTCKSTVWHTLFLQLLLDRK